MASLVLHTLLPVYVAIAFFRYPLHKYQKILSSNGERLRTEGCPKKRSLSCKRIASIFFALTLPSKSLPIIEQKCSIIVTPVMAKKKRPVLQPTLHLVRFFLTSKVSSPISFLFLVSVTSRTHEHPQ